MTGVAAEDRYNRVIYVELPLPPDFHVRQRSSPLDEIHISRRGPRGAKHLCQRCGAKFVSKGRAAAFKRVRGKVYRRRFCSRACYRQSLIGRPADSQGGTPA